MANTSAIVTQILRILRDERQTNYKDPELHTYFQLALEKLSDLVAQLNVAFGETNNDFSFSAAENSKDLPSDYWRYSTNERGIERVFITSDASRLTYAPQLTRETWEDETSADTGKPDKFWVNDTSFYVHPWCDTSYTIRLYYYPLKQLSALGGSSIVNEAMPWDSRLDPVIRAAVVMQCHQRSEMFAYQGFDAQGFMELKNMAHRIILGPRGIEMSPAPGYGWSEPGRGGHGVLGGRPHY